MSFAEECRQGTCGLCALVINGVPHGPGQQKTTCQITMSAFDAGSTINLEPWRAGALPVTEDLSVDRGALTRILDAASLPTSAAGANAGPQGVCIECGACAAACPNASAALFVGAKLKEHGRRPEPRARVLNMAEQMDKEGFGACSSHRECAAACPKGIGLSVIAGLNPRMASGRASRPRRKPLIHPRADSRAAQPQKGPLLNLPDKPE